MITLFTPICALLSVRAPSLVSPFLVSFDEHDAGLFRNYAIPDDNATPTEAQVAELVAVFTAANVRPRLEYLPGCAPDVEHGLLAAGFVPSGGYR